MVVVMSSAYDTGSVSHVQGTQPVAHADTSVSIKTETLIFR